MNECKVYATDKADILCVSLKSVIPVDFNQTWMKKGCTRMRP